MSDLVRTSLRRVLEENDWDLDRITLKQIRKYVQNDLKDSDVDISKGVITSLVGELMSNRMSSNADSVAIDDEGDEAATAAAASAGLAQDESAAAAEQEEEPSEQAGSGVSEKKSGEEDKEARKARKAARAAARKERAEKKAAKEAERRAKAKRDVKKKKSKKAAAAQGASGGPDANSDGQAAPGHEDGDNEAEKEDANDVGDAERGSGASAKTKKQRRKAAVVAAKKRKARQAAAREEDEDSSSSESSSNASSDSDDEEGQAAGVKRKRGAPKRSKRQQARKARAKAKTDSAEGDEGDETGAGGKRVGTTRKKESAPLDKIDQALANLKKKKAKPEQEQLMEDMRHFVYQMHDAHEADLHAYENKQTAVAKLRLMPRVTHTLRMSHLHEILIGQGILKIMKTWLDPMPNGTLASLGVRTGLLKALHNSLPENLQSDDLKESRIGHVVMFLSQHPLETEENKRLCHSLIARWSRPIYDRAANMEDVLSTVKVVRMDDRRGEENAAAQDNDDDDQDEDDEDEEPNEDDLAFIDRKGDNDADAADYDEDDDNRRVAKRRKVSSSPAASSSASAPRIKTSFSSASSLTTGQRQYVDVSKLKNDTTVIVSEITGKIRRPRVSIPATAPRTFSVMPASTVAPVRKSRVSSGGGADEAEEAPERRRMVSSSLSDGGARQPLRIEQKMANLKRKQAARSKKSTSVSINKLIT